MDQSGELIFELLIATDELLLEELFYKLQDYLIKKQSNWIQDNLISVLNTVFTLPNCNVVQDYCMEILKDSKYFMKSEDFPLLKKNILCELIKRDDFLGDEVVVWDCLIKWSIEKIPSLRSKNKDKSNWNDDFEALKETFSQFIPFIRFSEISSADFFDKVRPFKAIIPNNIYEEFIEFHMKGTLPVNSAISPPRIAKLDIESKIIKPVHAHVIANWIEGKDAKAIRNKNDLRYNFNLLYSGRNDGFDVRKFRSKCMNKGPCLILIKPSTNNLTQSTSENNLDTCNTRSVSSPLPTQNLAKIYGEYYSGIFTKDIWDCTTENFIFSFENDTDIKNMKICRMNYNIILDKSCGDFDPTNTFRMKGQNISVNNLAYNDNNVINSNMTKFVPMEIEVFRTTCDI
ncbi:hypothetical protein C1646_777580 [Rhizophagus diaphanus]|nr:hypothetical protein C1646_777580 [Rhizophagus diaphanus] [Rhizophagus sp. MUCL 43196]